MQKNTNLTLATLGFAGYVVLACLLGLVIWTYAAFGDLAAWERIIVTLGGLFVVGSVADFGIKSSFDLL